MALDLRNVCPESYSTTVQQSNSKTLPGSVLVFTIRSLVALPGNIRAGSGPLAVLVPLVLQYILEIIKSTEFLLFHNRPGQPGVNTQSRKVLSQSKRCHATTQTATCDLGRTHIRVPTGVTFHQESACRQRAGTGQGRKSQRRRPIRSRVPGDKITLRGPKSGRSARDSSSAASLPSSPGPAPWRPWTLAAAGSQCEQEGNPQTLGSKDAFGFQHPVRLYLPISKHQEYLRSSGEKVLASFPVQATIHFYNDASESEEEEEQGEEMRPLEPGFQGTGGPEDNSLGGPSGAWLQSPRGGGDASWGPSACPAPK
ncbi:protein ripply3 [Fukomys damarensis]|uniref:protein ripply3 n=1 Tax=Fukomys damarensis TaxID=885580 RepID=UPI00053F4169|nr:protein ripply3 [Fukomys damarensis]